MNTAFDRTKSWHQIDLGKGERYLAYAAAPAPDGKSLPVSLYGPSEGPVMACTEAMIEQDGTILLGGSLRAPISRSGNIIVLSCDENLRVENSYNDVGGDETYSASPSILNGFCDEDGLSDDEAEELLIIARENTLGDNFCRL